MQQLSWRYRLMLKWLTQWAAPSKKTYYQIQFSFFNFNVLYSPIKIAQSRQKFDWKILTYEMTYLAIDAHCLPDEMGVSAN